jgi:GDP-mannose 6-dehydrogenase
MKLSVFGLGYVGAVSLGCLARDGHEVVGVDIDPVKLQLIRQGRSPVIEEGMKELFENVAASGRVRVTNDAHEAVHATELSFLCVGTPCARNGSQDLTAMIRLSEQLGEALRTKDADHVFVVRSTIEPGTLETVIKPILEERSGKRMGEGFGLCFQPEFLREGTSIADYDNPPLTLLGADSERCVETVRAVFGHLPCRFVSTSIRSAEMLKYCCNIFHALKITFANEIGRICQSLGVDSHEVMDLVCQDTHLNISRAYMKPGFAFGGSCLPKDLRALLYVARSHDVDVPMLSGIMPSNETHVSHALDLVLQTGDRSVGMIGLSFKSGTDDLRESPLVTLAESFIGKGLDLKIHDPEVSLSRLIGANRRYIEESIPHIGSLMCESVDELLETRKVIVVGLRDKPLMQKLHEKLTKDHVVIDLVDIPDRESLPARYHGVCW